jgi:hypothetical protein
VNGLLLYVVFSWAFAFAILMIELLRRERGSRIDFLSAISIAFLVIFVAAPNVLYLTPPDAPAFEKFTWMRNLPAGAWLYAGIAGTVATAFACICFGYLVPAPTTLSRRADDDLNLNRAYLFFGCLLLLIGTLCFFAFMEIVGGPAYAFEHAWRLRAGTPDGGGATNFAFVKRLAFFVVPGSVFLIQAASRAKQNITVQWSLACVGVFVALVFLVFVQGRLLLLAYVLAIALAFCSTNSQASAKTRVVRVCAFLMILVTIYAVGLTAKPMSLAVYAPPETDASSSVQALTEAAQGKTSEPGGSEPGTAAVAAGSPAAPEATMAWRDKVSLIGLEFAFPFVNLTSDLVHVPGDVDYRWFSDLVLPLFHLVPKRLVPIANYLPPRLYNLNTRAQVGDVFWAIPVDLISFGWYSLGLTGVMIVGLGFGRLVRLLELSMPSGNLGDEVFRFSWLIIVAALIMYGDPNWLIIEMFHWIVALLIYFYVTSNYSAFRRVDYLSFQRS